MRNATKFVRKPEERDHLGDIGTASKIILK
jgi:hypothetical protein